MFTSLDDLVGVSILWFTDPVNHVSCHLFPLFQIQICGMKNPAEFEDRHAFVDLLKLLLHVDGNRRISASEALNHPFITMCHLKEPSYRDL